MPWYLRVDEPSTWWKRLNRLGSSCGGMPMPLSVTSMTARSPALRQHSRTRPPRGVNLIALVSRLITTFSMRDGSAATIRPSGGAVHSICSPLASAR